MYKLMLSHSYTAVSQLIWLLILSYEAGIIWEFLQEIFHLWIQVAYFNSFLEISKILLSFFNLCFIHFLDFLGFIYFIHLILFFNCFNFLFWLRFIVSFLGFFWL